MQPSFTEPRDFPHEEFLDAIRAQSQLLPDGAMGVLGELAASDKCMIGVLNNEARATNDYRFDKFGIRKYLKVAFSSCYVGLRKPGQAIYKRAVDILGVPAERILFIDDRAENAAGAESVGMKAVRFTGSAAPRGDLASLGVL